MKIKRVLKLFILVSVSVSVSQFFPGQGLKVEVFNRTGFDLDSVSIGDKYIGVIKKNGSFVVTDLKEFEMQDMMPFGLPGGTIKGKKKNRSFVGLCGTGVHTVSKGNYKFDITLHEGEEGYRLHWGIHQ